ncbi:meiosis-specific protein MEI4 [Lampris incognitus]|uniref:meiosis-specific protein MEI4 n=1 Tax=Lampris incognitus TaxID=2546036 RepID=UPI0024B4EF04|nr:meiosis-specific protein MEI4 [Lampris incognitus]
MRKVRLALAVAVIKSRPSGQSSREYTEGLSCRLKKQDEGWRRRARELQEEVLRLRQELLLTKMTSEAESAGGDNTMNILSSDLLDLVRELSSANPDSGCGTENNTETLLSTVDSQQTVDPPLPSVSTPQPLFPTCQGGPQSRAMLHHQQFLQSLCGLCRVDKKDGGLEVAWLRQSEDASVLVDSVYHLLEALVEVCRNSDLLLPSAPFLLQACQVAARAVDLWCFRRKPSVQFVTQMEEPLKGLMLMLLHSHRLNGFQVERTLTECVVQLGASSVFRSLIIRHLLSQINSLTQQLWLTCQEKEMPGHEWFAVNQYENSLYLFWILEQLLQRATVTGEREKINEPGFIQEQRAFKEHLEQHIFLLSDEFPLFALYMWRIGALLPPIHNV